MLVQIYPFLLTPTVIGTKAVPLQRREGDQYGVVRRLIIHLPFESFERRMQNDIRFDQHVLS